jgi:hypothetical protein
LHRHHRRRRRSAPASHRGITFNSFASGDSAGEQFGARHNPEFHDMRLPIIPPAQLNAEQKPLYDDMREGIARNFQGFVNIRDDAALLGPWNPWIHEPKLASRSGS